MKLSGKQTKALRQALVNAFSTRDDLRRMLREELDRNLDAIALGDSLDDIASKVIAKAEAYGWLRALIDGARAANPDNEPLARCAEDLAAPQAPDTPEGRFERIISASHPFLHIDVFLDFLERSKRRVCRIETTGGQPMGTGFLVAEDVLLTNHHVISSFIGATRPLVRARFDHLAGIDGLSASAGRTYPLAADWLLASAPPSPWDFVADAVSSPPDPAHLDFALLRLGGAPGSEQVNGAPRGWVHVPKSPPVPNADDLVCVIQHPAGQPLQITIDRVLGLDGSRTRIRYRANTLGGASGSPCFDLHRQLVALHHGGVEGSYNQGISAAALRDHLGGRGLDGLLGGTSP